ncbi:lipoxygenase homology domain-containing protein 1-like [Carassius auratus]|uniref:Lipoxygenase homology domain-containing protein 1-like n=1 Tax=Carassius auratus TaxID=7957 RepID=A0A6P6IYV4_CARAU|nr:lipoxygenase homology domain-containing protein 1-like [Carassius auratus]
MPTKEKKTKETEESDDEGEEKEPTVTGKSKRDSRQKSSENKTESTETPTEKRKKSQSVKEKKKKKKKEDVEVTENDNGTDEQNNNEPISKEKHTSNEKREVRKEKKKKSKPSESKEGQEDMGSKEKKSKDGKKKKKSAEEEEDEDAVQEEAEEEEDKKKKKKDKKKKKGSDSDEEKKAKKGKKSKVKQVDYAEVYQEELVNYHTEESDDQEDEFNKKKVYEVVTVTGDVKGAGTDANVFVTLFGEFGVTPKVHLASNTEKRSRTAFEKNKTDVFRIKTHNVGPIKKIRIEHDNTGMSASWFLDRVIVTDMNRPHLRFFYACNNWLSRDEGDGLTVRYLLGSLNPMDIPKQNKYIASVFTMDAKGSGTDADVYLNIFGEFGDTGERKLASDGKDNFERGNEDKFTIEAPNLGRLRKITIGHNNKGSSAGWACDKVVVDDMGNKEVYEFPVNAWFDISEGDGKIQRDVLAGATQPMAIVYNVQVMTGDIRGAGTNSKIHFVMHGHKGIKNSGKLFLEGGTFERAQIDIFNVELLELLSPLSRVTIGHDNAGISCGWYCEKVTVYCPFTGLEQVFPCGRWLDEDEGDGLVERELYEMVSLRQKKQKKLPWSLWIWTSEIKGAGTDAQVFLQVYGETGKSDQMKLESKSDSFEQGQCDKFIIEMPDIGKIRKVRIWHEKRNPFSGWHLGRVTLMKTLTREKYSFVCNRWLDINEDDNEIIRELPATGKLVPEPLPLIKYRVTICTGNISGSGTDASVYLNIIGDLGDTGERLMFMSKNNANKFEKGNHDEFLVEAVTLGQIRRVRIGHDGRGGGCGWFLDKVMVREEGQPEASSIEFPCYRWLDRNEDDGQIVRELVPTDDGQRLFTVGYHIAIKTGSINGASSDSKVFVKLYGEKGDTNKMLLVVSDNDLGNYFETAQTDIFTIETFDIGKINRMLIGHTNEGLRAGWFLDSVQIWVPVHGVQYMFPSHRWLCKDEADGKVEVEIYPSETLEIEKLINYEVTVVTGDVWAGGTNANVFLQIYGEEGKTELIQLKSRSNNFERGTTEIFRIEGLDVGRVYKIRIGHDGSGIGAGWFLEKVDIKRLVMAMVKPEKKEEDKKDKKKKKKKKEEEEESPGELKEVVRTFSFPCGRWLARDEEDGEILVELRAEDYEDLEENSYEVHVFTGDMLGAGTDASVFINIYGEMGDTGERKLRKSNHLNKFERGQEDVFTITGMDLGSLKKLRIRHDNKQANAAWYLDRVEIFDAKDETMYFFPCQRWLAVDEDDGQLGRELVPVDEAFMRRDEDEEEESSPAQLGLEQKAMSTTFTMRVKTGEKKNAGTDANVYAILYGTKDDTGIINLKASKNHRNKYELGLIDEFTIEAVDIGKLKRMCIGHDNAGVSPGWFLDWVEIDAPSLGQLLRFPCGRWLDKGKDDGAIVRDLYPNELQTVLYTPFVPYEIKIFTSDIFAAGTDADVFIVLYGQNGVSTSQKSLCVNKRERRMYFERGAEDMFIVELEDIGDIIEKIRIGHDNRGVNPGWHLDRVEIRRLLRKGKGSETTIFPCEGWLARSEEDGETIRELVPSDIIVEKLSRDGTLKVIETEVDDALEIHTYTVMVTTGDVYGAGTDANVFITLYGDMGDTGERKLSKSENSNKFERGSVDTFTLEAVDLGQVFKIRVRHDNSMLSADWYLEQVEVADQDTEEVFLFLCERWLSRKKEDRRIDRVFYVKGYEGERETAFCPIKKVTNLDSNMNKKNKKRHSEEEDEEGSLIPYHFSVTTGWDRDAGTSSRVYVIIIGKKNKKTDRLWLDSDGKNRFLPGSLDYFTCYGTDVGDIKKVELGHDGATPESCWLVEELTVDVPTKAVRYVFPCKCWLAKDRGDGLTARFFDVQDAEPVNIPQKVIYEVTVITGDVQHAGTDTQIYMTVFGVYGTSEEMLLPKLEDRFERGQTDTFNLEIEDIAPLRKMRVRIDGSGSRPDWFLDKIELHNLQTDEVALFMYEEWLSRSYGPKRTLLCEMPAVIDEEEMVELTTYTVSVKTSDVTAAGTDANVWMVIFGENGDTGTLTLKESNNTNKFERKQMDTFRFPDILSLGELSKVRIWHDNAGLAAGWHLEYVDVHDDILGKKFRFQCDRWLAKNEDDGQIMRELACANNDAVDFDEKTKYEILVTTADMDDAETKENAWIVLEGKKGRSKEFVMENSTKKKRFLRGASDRFEFSSKELGDIASICLGHIPKDGKKVKVEASWFVEQVVVTEKELGNKYIFRCEAAIPLSSKRDEFQTFECSKFIESFTSKAQSLVPVKYELIVITGDEKGAGTDANVFITIFGSNGDSGQRQLTKKFQNLFERGKTNRFILELLDLGDLLRMHVEHDNSGLSPGWLLSRIEITNTANAVTTVFICGKWLDKNKADGRIKRVIYPKY